MMKFFFMAIIFAFADGASDLIEDCVRVCGKQYEKEIIKSNVFNPYQLAIDHNTNTLFYSYTARSTEDMFKSAYLDMNTYSSGTVTGIKGGFANAVNNNNNIVYMGGEDGLYKFDYRKKSATNLYIKENENIWQMFYRDGLYFTTYPKEEAYFFKNYHVVKLQPLLNINVMLVATDTDKNLVYFNSSGVFRFERSKDRTVFLSNAVANGVTSDRDGNIIFSSPNGIYNISVGLEQAKHMAHIDNVYGVAMESNGHIIYATERSLIRLKPATKSCKKPKKPTTAKVIQILIGN